MSLTLRVVLISIVLAVTHIALTLVVPETGFQSRTLFSLPFSIAAFDFVLIAAVWCLLQRGIVGPLEELSVHLRPAENRLDPLPEHLCRRGDEIGLLALNISQMIRRNRILDNERVQAENLLKQKEEAHRSLLQSMPGVVIRYDREGRHLFVSRDAEVATGISSSHMMGRTQRELGFPEPVCAQVDDAIRRVCENGAYFDTEFSLEGKQGWIIFEWRFLPEFDSDGAVESVLSIGRDVTELRRLEKDYEILFHEMPDGLALHEIIFDAREQPSDYRFLSVNPAFERLTGLKAHDILGKTVLEVLPGVEPHWVQAYGSVVVTGKPISFENYCAELDRHFKVRAFRPGRRQFGCIFSDITRYKRGEMERDRMRRDLNRRERELEFLLAGAGSVLDEEDFNRAAGRIFNKARDLIGAQSGYFSLLRAGGEENEMLLLESGGLPCSVDPSFPMPVQGLEREASETGCPVLDNDFMNGTWAAYLPSGHVNLKNVMFVPMRIQNKTAGVMGFANKPDGFTEDDLRMAESFGRLAALALQKSRAGGGLRGKEERYRTEPAPVMDGFLILDDRGFVLEANESYCRMSGYSEEELVGMYFGELDVAHTPRDTEARIRRVLDQGGDRFISRHRRKDGSLFAVYVNVRHRPMEGTRLVACLRDMGDCERA